MALPPQKFREIIFQILYSNDFDPGDAESERELSSFMMAELKVTRRIMAEAQARKNKIIDALVEIDADIAAASTEYSFDRISRVERTILRLGVFEILFDKEIPPVVAIAEAIRLCRKFGTPESAHFVNAILDKIYKKVGKEAGKEVSKEDGVEAAEQPVSL